MVFLLFSGFASADDYYSGHRHPRIRQAIIELRAEDVILQERINSIPEGPIGPQGPQGDIGALNAASGVISHSEFMDCIAGEYGGCEEKTTALVSVPRGGGRVEFHNTRTTSVKRLGQLIIIKLIVKFYLWNSDPTGPGGRTIYATVLVREEEYTDPNGEVTVQENTYDSLELRIDQPVLNPQLGLFFRMALVSDSLVAIVMDSGVWKNITTEIEGDIDSAFVQYNEEDAQQAQIKAKIINEGEFTAQYVVTVKGCSGNIEAVPFKIISVEPYYQDVSNAKTLLFDLRTDTAFAAGDACKVELQALTGRSFSEVEVTFPDPS